jgi:hypothetical protein
MWWQGGNRNGAVDAWEVEDLVSHLRRKGLEFRAVPTAKLGPLNRGAYLTTTDKPWERLIGLSANPELIGEWEGTVYCVRARVEREGDARLRYGAITGCASALSSSSGTRSC